jgi:hypothetical protein
MNAVALGHALRRLLGRGTSRRAVRGVSSWTLTGATLPRAVVALPVG